MVLLLASVALVVFKVVKVKMLPFDNKSEFQVMVDMPQGTPLEDSLRAAQQLAQKLTEMREVTDYQIYAGTSAPITFNGLVRHYYLRRQPHSADIQVNLLPKGDRSKQSHELAKEARQMLLPLAAQLGVKLKVIEVPPGPPVLSTLVAEIYGPNLEGQLDVARDILKIYKDTAGVVDADLYAVEPQALIDLQVDPKRWPPRASASWRWPTPSPWPCTGRPRASPTCPASGRTCPSSSRCPGTPAPTWRPSPPCRSRTAGGR